MRVCVYVCVLVAKPFSRYEGEEEEEGKEMNSVPGGTGLINL